MTCTARRSPRCCSSTWCRSPATAGYVRSPAGRWPKTGPCLRMFADAGLPIQRQAADGVVELTFPHSGRGRRPQPGPLPRFGGRPGGAWRTWRACGTCFRPASVAVVGASRSRGTVDRESSTTSSPGGSPARCTRSTRGPSMEGLQCLASMAGLRTCGRGGDGAPPRRSPVAAQCGQRAPVPSGHHPPASITNVPNCWPCAAVRHRLVAQLLRHRGVAARPERDVGRRGSRGRARRGGGPVRRHRRLPARAPVRLGIGVSSFASVGDDSDVSSNDMLTWWGQDGRDRAGCAVCRVVRQPAEVRPDRAPGLPADARAYRPRRPVHRWPACRRLAPAPRPRPWSPRRRVRPRQHHRGRGLGELVEAAALLAGRPLPSATGSRWCPTRAARVCSPPTPAATTGCRWRSVSATRRRLAELLPSGAAVAGPVDAAAAVGQEAFAPAWRRWRLTTGSMPFSWSPCPRPSPT